MAVRQFVGGAREVPEYTCPVCKRRVKLRPCQICPALEYHGPALSIRSEPTESEVLKLNPEIQVAAELVQSEGFTGEDGWHGPWDEQRRTERDQYADSRPVEFKPVRVE